MASPFLFVDSLGEASFFDSVDRAIIKDEPVKNKKLYQFFINPCDKWQSLNKVKLCYLFFFIIFGLSNSVASFGNQIGPRKIKFESIKLIRSTK
jgi:hypothetical protein